MPQFGSESRAVLDTVRPELVKTLEIVVIEFDISALEGRRSPPLVLRAKVMLPA